MYRIESMNAIYKWSKEKKVKINKAIEIEMIIEYQDENTYENRKQEISEILYASYIDLYLKYAVKNTFVSKVDVSEYLEPSWTAFKYALSTFDTTLGFRFNTYALHKIRLFMRRHTNLVITCNGLGELDKNNIAKENVSRDIIREEERKRDHSELNLLLDKLNDREREMVEDLYLNLMSHGEVSKKYNTSVTKVRIICKNALEKMRIKDEV